MLSKEKIERIEKALGYVFKNKQLLSQAFTRSSYHYEHLEEPDNEVLELIGDSVISLCAVNALTDKYIKIGKSGMRSDKNEGALSALKSALVNKQYLSKRMRVLNLQDYLLMSTGDRQQVIQNSDSVLEDLFESIVGAIYVDSGRNLTKTSEIANRLLDTETFLNSNQNGVHISYKNDLQELCQKHGLEMPEYITEMNLAEFRSTCRISDAFVQTFGFGLNKKTAEENAAQAAIPGVQNFLSLRSTTATIFDTANAINALQEYCQENRLPLPTYSTVSDEVDANNTHTFTVSCLMNDTLTYGTGTRLKDAKKQAAFHMLGQLGLID